MPQKGKILVSKTGEEFSSVQVSGDGVVDKDGNLAEGENIYTPVYAVTGQAGAVYEVIAAEDIVTPDGTVRANAGMWWIPLPQMRKARQRQKNCIWENTRSWKRQRRTVWC